MAAQRFEHALHTSAGGRELALGMACFMARKIA
jgi:hypothetical protein